MKFKILASDRFSRGMYRLVDAKVALLSVSILLGARLDASGQSNDYHPGQPVTFGSTPSSPGSSGSGYSSDKAEEKRLNWGQLRNEVSGAVNGLSNAARRPANYLGNPATYGGGSGNYAGMSAGPGNYTGAGVSQSHHIGMPNPAYPNGYQPMQAGPGYHPDGSGAGVGLDYNYILSHPPDMSHMPPVRPEFANTVNTMSDMAAQMGTTGYTDAGGWYHPGKPKNRRSLQAPGADQSERSLNLGK